MRELPIAIRVFGEECILVAVCFHEYVFKSFFSSEDRKFFLLVGLWIHRGEEFIGPVVDSGPVDFFALRGDKCLNNICGFRVRIVSVVMRILVFIVEERAIILLNTILFQLIVLDNWNDSLSWWGSSRKYWFLFLIAKTYRVILFSAVFCDCFIQNTARWSCDNLWWDWYSRIKSILRIIVRGYFFIIVITSPQEEVKANSKCSQQKKQW